MISSSLRRRARRGATPVAGPLLAFAFAALAAGTAGAERAWVRGAPLNLRTGPGTQFRIVDAVKTGDGVEIVERTDAWTQVRMADGKLGWIAAGYLDPQPPPTLRLEKLEQEVVELRGQLETVSAERDDLRATSSKLASNDDDQNARISELTRENMRLTAGQRWPEWITGGVMVCAGMLLGALWSRSAGRRASPRIRL